jgi:hypothetical protein
LGSLVELREVLEQTQKAIYGKRKEKNFLEKYEQNQNIEELIDSARAGLLAGPAATQVTRRNPLDSGSDSDDAGLIGAGRHGAKALVGAGGVHISYYAGLIQKSEIFQFKKVLFRASRGKVLCKVCDESPVDYTRVDPSLLASKARDEYVYVLVFQDVHVLRSKIKKICEIYSNGQTYRLPRDGQGSFAEYRDEILQVDKKIDKLKQLTLLSKA